MQKPFSVTINGKRREVTAHPVARLLDVLREDCGLTGTKEGCGEGECGACSVFLDGRLVNSCLVPIAQCQGKAVDTIEGIANDAKYSAVTAAFVDWGGAQCGICTPGMIMATVDLLRKHPEPTLEDVKDGLAGNLCRCTGYMKIFDSVQKAGAQMRSR